jgi:hypothetical protein
MAIRRTVVLLGACLLFSSPANSREVLTMRASGFARYLLVQLSVDASADNRELTLTVESPDFYRSSAVELDGENAPRTTVFELKGLPSNVYEVTGVLTGPNGKKASVARTVQVRDSWSRPER